MPAAATAASLRATGDPLITDTLRDCQGNITQAARRLGVSRGLLYRRLQRRAGAALVRFRVRLSGVMFSVSLMHGHGISLCCAARRLGFMLCQASVPHRSCSQPADTTPK